MTELNHIHEPEERAGQFPPLDGTRPGDDLVLTCVWGALKHAPGMKTANLCAILNAGWSETLAASLQDNAIEIGFLWVGRSRAEPFSERAKELLATLADLTALSIANVRAHERLQREARGDPGQRHSDHTLDGTRATPPPGTAHVPPAAEPVDADRLVVPPFPAALGRLLALAENDDSSPEAVEEAVGLDPALATRAMKLASAAALGRSRSVTSLREAVLVLGLRGIRNLAFAEFSRHLVIRNGLVDQLLWEHSLATAAGTQLVVEAREPELADDAYLCGLLHNVGAVALNSAHPERYEHVLRRAATGARPVPALEREEFGFETASVTAQLVSRWNLPSRVRGTLTSWNDSTVRGGEIGVALRWASTAAVRMNPMWQKLLGDHGEPSWSADALARAEAELGLSRDALDEVRRLTVSRCEVLRQLVA